MAALKSTEYTPEHNGLPGLSLSITRGDIGQTLSHKTTCREKRAPVLLATRGSYCGDSVHHLGHGLQDSCRLLEVPLLPDATGHVNLETYSISTRHTMPICLSIDCIRLFAPGTRSLEWMSFSTAKTTPSFTRRPIAVLTRNTQDKRPVSGYVIQTHPEFSTALFAYSTFKHACKIVAFQDASIRCNPPGIYDHRESKCWRRDRIPFQWRSWQNLVIWERYGWARVRGYGAGKAAVL